MREPTVGIDLGTRYAQIAVNDLSRSAKIIPNRWGMTRTPSFVALTKDGFVAGEDASRIALVDSSDAWWDMKRHLGTDWVARSLGRAYTPEELLLPLLSLLREDAEAYLKTFIFACTLAVPAHFSFPERGALARTAQQAGFERVRIVNEPTAAALSTGVDGRFLVIDFGAGTLDLSVVEGENGVFQVLESQGRSDIGGFDIDKRLADWIVRRSGEPLVRQDDPRWGLLISEAENIKINLSSTKRVSWNSPAGLLRSNGPIDVTRADLEALIAPLLDEIARMVERMWTRHTPQRMILVGGSSRIPLLRRMLGGRVVEPDKLRVCPEDAVVVGAAMYGTQGRERLLLDVLSRSLGIMNAQGGVVTLLERGMPLPAEARRRFNAQGTGTLEVTVVQGEGRVKSLNRVLETVRVERVGDGEEIEIIFCVDGGGLLRVEVCRDCQTYRKVIALESDETGTVQCDLPAELRLREERMARLTMSFSDGLQERILTLMTQARSLRDEPPELQWQALESLDRMIAEIEQVING